MTFQPMLLVGPSGIGKSHFCSELAKIFAVSTQTIQLNTSQSNSALSGSSTYWANTSPGKIFNTLLFGHSASPIFILEEIEKTSATMHSDPMNSLYQLFEPATSRKFCDLSYPWLEIDASRVIYFCTANSIENIAPALLSRLRIFSIPKPSKADSFKLVERIFKDLMKSLPSSLQFISMSPGCTATLSELPQRTVRNLLKDAIGRAVYQRQTSPISEANIRTLQYSGSNAGHRSIGFI
jgi:ATP-dependent Lon protease